MLKLHWEKGPAWVGLDGYKVWCLNGERVHPEALVDLWLSRGVFCYYDEDTESLLFDV